MLTLGRVNFLSKRFEELDTISPPATESERQEIMPRLQQIIMSKISTSNLPHEFTDATISKYNKLCSYLKYLVNMKHEMISSREWYSNIVSSKRISSVTGNQQR